MEVLCFFDDENRNPTRVLLATLPIMSNEAAAAAARGTRHI
jgi:hypothetical protein